MDSFNTLVAVADKTKFLQLSAVLQSHDEKITKPQVTTTHMYTVSHFNIKTHISVQYIKWCSGNQCLDNGGPNVHTTENTKRRQ